MVKIYSDNRVSGAAMEGYETLAGREGYMFRTTDETSNRATSMSVSSLKYSVILPLPLEETALMFSMPLMVLRLPSSTEVTSCSTALGEVFRHEKRTWTEGRGVIWIELHRQQGQDR